MNIKSIIFKLCPKFIKKIYRNCIVNYFKRKNRIINRRVKKLLHTEKQIKVAFLHMYATDCQNLCIFEKMLQNKLFDPFFIVNPDISRSKENFDLQYKKSVELLEQRYGKSRVLNGYDYKKNVFIDYSKNFDIMTTNNPYDVMAHKYFKISYWGKKNIPIFYISYFYMGRCHVTAENFQQKSFNYIWKIFVENKAVVKIAEQVELLCGKNVVVSGYPKFDKYAVLPNSDINKKIIIISPHHSIEDSDVSVGTFLEMEKVFLQLPKKYPDITFVFRPHPLLIEKLNTIWGKEKSNNWLQEFLKNKNTFYSEEGDYLQLFKDSTALIHDCGSYTAEYLFTEKPCAYIYRKSTNLSKTFTSFGKECLSMHYSINSEDDLYKFIENVVINEQDIIKNERIQFAKNEVLINYPNASDFIIKYISSYDE